MTLEERRAARLIEKGRSNIAASPVDMGEFFFVWCSCREATRAELPFVAPELVDRVKLSWVRESCPGAWRRMKAVDR